MANGLEALVAGGLLGYALGKEGKTTEAQAIKDLRADKPSLFQIIQLNVSEARDRMPFPFAGYTITVQNPEASSVPIYVRINEPEAEAVDIIRNRKLRAPFYQFFITNAAGTGVLTIIISKTPVFDPIGDLSALMHGVSSGLPVPIAVDASGNMLALIQGAYNGAFKTIAVDSKGRMLTVITDPEDVLGVAPQLGLSSLAARLRGIIQQYRTGDILFADDFSGSLAKYSWVKPGNGLIKITNEASLAGDFCCEIWLDNPDDEALLGSQINYPILSKLGLEICWRPATSNSDAKIAEVQFYLYIADGSSAWHAAIRYIPNPNGAATWYFRNSGGSWELIPSTLRLSVLAPHALKLIADFPNYKYSKLKVDGAEYDLSSKDLYRYGADDNRWLCSYIDIYGKPDPAPLFSIYQLFSYIITQNEP